MALGKDKPWKYGGREFREVQSPRPQNLPIENSVRLEGAVRWLYTNRDIIGSEAANQVEMALVRSTGTIYSLTPTEAQIVIDGYEARLREEIEGADQA